MKVGVGIVLLCFSKPPNDAIPVPKPVEVHKSRELYFILLFACVGWCTDYKNLHSVSKLKSEGRGLVKISGRKWMQIIQTDLIFIGPCWCYVVVWLRWCGVVSGGRLKH